VPADAKFTDTTYSEATTSNIGLMTPEMVVKLNSLSSTGGSGLVSSVNGQIGDVILSHKDVKAAPAEHTHNYAGSSSPGGSALSAEKLNKNGGSYV
jgi:hypothetical protein